MISLRWRRRPLRTLAERAFLPFANEQKRRPWPPFPCACHLLLDDDFDAAVLRLAHAVGGRNQEALLAHADYGNGLRRHAVAHQGVLDRIGAPERQRHVVALRA